MKKKNILAPLFFLMALCLVSCSQIKDDFKQQEALYDIQIKKTNETHASLSRKQAHINDGYTIKQLRESTGIDSGYSETMLFAQNANIRIVNNIGFYVDRLVGRLKPTKVNNPVVLDNPHKFELDILEGSVIITPQSLEEILNEHIFNFLSSTVKSLKAKTEGNSLVLSGKVNRKNSWINFALKGTLSVYKERYLILTPSDVFLEGRSATELLKMGKIELDEIISIDAPGAKLKGSKIWLDSTKFLPPPKINFLIRSVSIEKKGVRLNIKPRAKVAFPESKTNSNSFMVIRGGDMRIMRLLTLNTEVQIVPKQENEPLDFCFYDYRNQITQGSLLLQRDGSAIAKIQNYKHLSEEL